VSNDKRTMQELAQEALDIQDACNLSGVVHAFSRVVTQLRELHPRISTDVINTHPICVMYASKIVSLTRCESTVAFGLAYDWVTATAKE